MSDCELNWASVWQFEIIAPYLLIIHMYDVPQPVMVNNFKHIVAFLHCLCLFALKNVIYFRKIML